ncbi:PTS lactose/cellobiose transporter subunit IIA [Tissierella sp. MSJ-40]|uniref:PTS lactose/cellobiose transporter subunit IIA n=1 Tax=Tissierella simiarum TaxID=2841534 RepID=A0ABS6E1Z0_9FIRM|nr:PTS lactose/cellobiose transporter subunit IIA [Tissierella simiarum]MBU5436912.1 PTS lactose/cellobiose transporter subunit IIA [Tissierella simiarum]
MANIKDLDIEEEIIFNLISCSGEGRSLIFEAFNAVKKEEYNEAEKLMDMATESILKAHNIQTKLIQGEAAGQHREINLLMVHAQDHLMSTILSQNLIKNMISMQKEINQLKNELKNK